MNEVLARLRDMFSPHRIGEFLAGDLIPDLVAALAAFLAFYLVHRLVQRALRLGFARASLDATAQAFVRSVARWAILTVAVVTALAQLGVNVASLLTSLGVAGLTIGFAAKDVLSNVISGFFIFWDRPFVVGDLVEVQGDYGRVEEITMRSTRIVTPDGKMLAIPNSVIVSVTVTSYTNSPHLRIDLDFTVGVGEDLGRVRATALTAIEEGDPRFRAGSARVVVTALNDYNVAMQLRVWILDERSHLIIRPELRERLFEVLREADVDMPYETFEIHSRAS